MWFVLNLGLMGARDSLEGVAVLPIIVLSWLGMGTGLAAGFVGLWAVVRRGERGALVFLAMVPGAFALVFLLGELLVPH